MGKDFDVHCTDAEVTVKWLAHSHMPPHTL